MVENQALILQLLRDLRGEIAHLRGEIRSEVRTIQADMAAIEKRLSDQIRESAQISPPPVNRPGLDKAPDLG